jgi:hypothetical protein
MPPRAARRAKRGGVVETKGAGDPTIAIIAAPKPFYGHAGLIQRNAVASWRRLGPNVEILLGGDVDGLADVARQHGAKALGPILDGADGPPRVDDLFAKAVAASRADLFVYVNSDIMLMPDWLEAVLHVERMVAGQFLLIGRRIDLDVDAPISFDAPGTHAALLRRARDEGSPAARVCKDYFVFRRDGYPRVPAFTLGRAFWDNWMVYDAHRRGLPVIDLTECATAIHQNHDYAHLAGGRLAAYLTSAGARTNRALAGGSRMVSGAAASCRLRRSGRIERLRAPAVLTFGADFHRFVGLTLAVVLSGAWQIARQATWRAGSPVRWSAGQASGAVPKMPSRQAA